MSGQDQTRATLLMRIRDLRDRAAWGQFVDLYQPIIHGYLRKRGGLRDADAADVAQETLHTVLRSIERFKYDPAKGRFRGWLLTVARRQLAQYLERTGKAAAHCASGHPDAQEALASIPDDADAQHWERECQQQTLAWAMHQIEKEFQPRTWQAFYATAVDDASPQRVADDLSMSVSAVYIAKSRVTARLRQVVDEVEDDG